MLGLTDCGCVIVVVWCSCRLHVQGPGMVKGRPSHCYASGPCYVRTT
jgi:hypothetical protein